MNTIDFQLTTNNLSAWRGQMASGDLRFTFPRPVVKAVSAIAGFQIGFENDDHELLRMVIDTSVTSWSGNTVTVRFNFGLRDSSGEWDDPYGGHLTILVIAELRPS